MLVINQYRAHQRILYEEFLQSITVKEAVSQQLLFPLDLRFTTVETAILQGMEKQLQQAGFIFSKLDHDAVSLSAVPVCVTDKNASEVLEQLINDVGEPGTGQPFQPE